MKRLLLVLLTALPGFLFAQKQIINDENVEPRDVGSFTAIKVSNAINLYISQAEKESMAVSAVRQEYRDQIKTTIENGVLRIWFDSKGRFMRNAGSMKLKVYLSFREINRITASGASDVTVTGTIKANDLVLDMSGASDFRGTIEAAALTVDLGGASDAIVRGKVEHLKVDAGGASDFKSYDLVAENATVDASGASEISITVNKELNAKASGASGIYYKGTAVIRNIRTSGASNVSKRS